MDSVRPPHKKVLASSAASPLPLTAKEKQVLEFIEQFVHLQGIAPSYLEIKDNFGFASFNSVQRYLKQLQAKGYLHIPGDNQKRAIQLLHTSTSYQSLLKEASAKPTTQNPYPTQQKKEAPRLESSPPQVESLSLPLLGRVAAGTPIEAFTHDEFIDVPPSMVRYPSKTFGLVVQGQSMIEDGIFDGDFILIQRQTYANNGETVVALVNNQATVKRFYLHSTKPHSPTAQGADQSDNELSDFDAFPEDVHSDPQVVPHSHARTPIVELRPANSSMQSMWFAQDDLQIQGIVVALLRRY